MLHFLIWYLFYSRDFRHFSLTPSYASIKLLVSAKIHLPTHYVINLCFTVGYINRISGRVFFFLKNTCVYFATTDIRGISPVVYNFVSEVCTTVDVFKFDIIIIIIYVL